MRRLVVVIVAAMLMVGCAQSAQPVVATSPPATARPAPTAPPVPTAAPPTVPMATALPTSSPTPAATALPSTAAPAASPTPVPATPLDGQALVDALRRGGYVIVFRHAATDWSQRDQQHTPETWSSSDPRVMRQLSDAGRAQARAAGAAMRALGIPVGQVLASPYRRTQETAELLGFGPVETTTDVVNMYAAGQVGGRAQLVATARQRFATVPPARTNTVIVTHGNVVQAAANITLQEGEAAIIAPAGADGFAVVARMPAEAWARLAPAAPAVTTSPLGVPSGAVCEPTPADDPGQFYEPDAPVRTSVGQGHVLRGVVRSAEDCAPIPGARIEFWLAGPDGTFDSEHRATVIADDSGAYRFESNVPPAYDRDPPHIFVRISAPGYRTLVTRYYPIAGQAEGTFDLVLVPEG